MKREGSIGARLWSWATEPGQPEVNQIPNSSPDPNPNPNPHAHPHPHPHPYPHPTPNPTPNPTPDPTPTPTPTPTPHQVNQMRKAKEGPDLSTFDAQVR